MEAHQEGGLLVYVKKNKKMKENECEEDCFFNSYMWRGAHGKSVCKD